MNKAVVFYGGDSQVGTTMVALAAAEMLVRQNRTVLFVSAGESPGIPFVQKGMSASVDDLRFGLKERTLIANDLRQCIVTSRGLDILPGVRSWHSSRDYDRDAVAQIRQLAAEAYDYVITDGGSGLEGLSLAALQGSELACIVATQQEKTLDRMRTRLSLVQTSLPERRFYVINKFQDSRAFYTMRELETRIGCGGQQMLRIDYVPYGWQAEKDCRTLLDYRQFRKGIKAVTAYLEEEGEQVGI